MVEFAKAFPRARKGPAWRQKKRRAANCFLICFAPATQMRHTLAKPMIKRIKIRDFKSIQALDLELDPVTVLVGRSGTGKSNVVQAIRFLRNLLLDCQQAVVYEAGWERIVPEGEKTPQPSLEVIFSVPGKNGNTVTRWSLD